MVSGGSGLGNGRSIRPLFHLWIVPEANMLSDQENHRLAEIELHFRVSDPAFFARMARRSELRRPWYRRWLRRV
jgi:Protein of unknown function (DUF3040)